MEYTREKEVWERGFHPSRMNRIIKMCSPDQEPGGWRRRVVKQGDVSWRDSWRMCFDEKLKNLKKSFPSKCKIWVVPWKHWAWKPKLLLFSIVHLFTFTLLLRKFTKLIFLLIKYALNWSKVTVTTLIILKTLKNFNTDKKNVPWAP